MKRIGVFVCHCGVNIAGTVDIEKVKKAIQDYPGVAVVKDHIYCCSDPGQSLIKETISSEKLDGVVVACCSPSLHENTFRKAAASVGLNQYVLEIANIREQCSWVTEDKAEATRKAIRIIRTIVEKVNEDKPLVPLSVPVTRRALVIGGGIAGIQASLDIANAGAEVLLVEREPSVGGHMAQLSETFPTLDCSQCILTPKMVEVAQNPRIRLMTYAEVIDVAGFVGNFKARIRKKARHVDMEKCTSCGDCWNACPVRNEPQMPAAPDYDKLVKPAERKKLDGILAAHAPANPGMPGGEALIQVLQDVNQEYGYLPDYALKYISQRLGVSLSRAYHVATFYTAFSLRPRGEHVVRVCMGTACHARGAPRVLEEFERQLGIARGDTTPDLKFTLETVNCLGCCALGPVVMVDQQYHSVEPGEVSALLKRYAGGEGR